MLNIVCGLAVHNPSGGTLDFKWREWLNGGKNQNPKKSLDQELTPQKCQAKLFVLFLQNYNLARIRKYYLVLNTPKNPYFKSNHQKINTWQIFLPKKILESKISNPPKSFYYACHLKSGVPQWVHNCWLTKLLYHSCYLEAVCSKSVKGSGNSTFLQKDQLCYLKRAEKLTFCIHFS